MQSYLEKKDDYNVDLKDILTTLWQEKLLIFTGIIIVLCLALFYLFIAKPLYKTNVLMQIETNQSSILPEGLEILIQSGSEIASEIKLIQSRILLNQVIEQLQLDIISHPYYFPIIGEAIARKNPDNTFTTNFLNLNQYAWGGEFIKIGVFEVIDAYIEQPFTILVKENQNYIILDQDNQSILEGKVGILSENAQMKIKIEQLHAKPNTKFYLEKQSRIAAIEKLKAKMFIQEDGFKTNLLLLTLKGYQPKKIKNIAQSLAELYVQQNIRQHSEEAEKMLGFIAEQIPDLKKNVQKAETALNVFRQQEGTMNISLESRAHIDELVEIEKQKSMLQLEEHELLQRYTKNHPLINSLQEKLSTLDQKQNQIEKEFKALSDTELKIIRLTRDLEISNELYMLLLNRSQELKIAKAGTIGNVRIVDSAFLPREPVAPEKFKILLIALLLGSALGISFIALKQLFYHKITDPSQIENKFQISVFATILESKEQKKLSQNIQKKKSGRHLLIHQYPQAMILESLRNLCTALSFHPMKHHIMLITSSLPEMGKSFISANVSSLLTELDKKVLLIDADMRKPKLHYYFGEHHYQKTGLADILHHEIDYQEVIQEIAIEENKTLYFIPAGKTPINPSRLLIKQSFKNLLDNLEAQFDYIVIDTPPILLTMDAMIIAKLAAVQTFLITRAYKEEMIVLQETFKRLENNNIDISGVILNGFINKNNNSYYHYSYK